MSAAPATTHDRPWEISLRWQEYEGEGRANLLRVIAVGAFYVVQWLHFLGLTNATDAERMFHRHTTWLVAAWLMVALAVLISLQRRILPRYLKYVSTGADLALLTTLAWLGHGPASPLVGAYYVVIALAAVRFSVPLIWFATVGAMAGYLLLVARVDQTWFDADHTVPVVTQLATHLSLALTGVMTGQVVRRTRGLAEDFLARAKFGQGGLK